MSHPLLCDYTHSKVCGALTHVNLRWVGIAFHEFNLALLIIGLYTCYSKSINGQCSVWLHANSIGFVSAGYSTIRCCSLRTAYSLTCVPCTLTPAIWPRGPTWAACMRLWHSQCKPTNWSGVQNVTVPDLQSCRRLSFVVHWLNDTWLLFSLSLTEMLFCPIKTPLLWFATLRNAQVWCAMVVLHSGGEEHADFEVMLG